jgi:hypothetical protein
MFQRVLDRREKSTNSARPKRCSIEADYVAQINAVVGIDQSEVQVAECSPCSWNEYTTIPLRSISFVVCRFC